MADEGVGRARRRDVVADVDAAAISPPLRVTLMTSLLASLSSPPRTSSLPVLLFSVL